jgi:thiamine biosynthesis lipoprotein
MAKRAWVEQIMGLPISVHLRGDSLAGSGAVQPAVERAVAAVFAELREVDALFSTYRPDSQVSAINRGALGPDDYHPWLRTVIDLCREARERTDGYFDAWLPGPGAGAVRFDPSGLVKGWAVERAASHLRDLDPLDFCLNAGGDIVVSGEWKVGVENPTDPGRLLATLTVVDGAVATSGSAHRGGHIVVPRTGAAAQGVAAVTVTGQSLTWADVLATAAVARGVRVVDWIARLNQRPAAGFRGYEAMAVADRGAVSTTAGWCAVFTR